MIKNKRQYCITKAQIGKFRDALTALRLAPRKGVHSALVKAQEDALESQLGDLLTEVREYEALQAGEPKTLRLESLNAIPRALIRARIAQGLTQKDLAEKVGLREQQIQRYEATEYAGANFARIQEVIHALNLRIRETAFLETAGQ